MRNPARLLALALALCGAGSAWAETSPATAGEATRAFASSCLASLPAFGAFPAKAAEAGLRSGPGFGPIRKGFWLADRALFVGTIASPVGPTCIMVVEGKVDAKALGKSVLAAARKATGGKGQAQPTDFFVLAEHLPNGSLLTVDHRAAPGRSDMTILSLSGPVDAKGVAALMHD